MLQGHMMTLGLHLLPSDLQSCPESVSFVQKYGV